MLLGALPLGVAVGALLATGGAGLLPAMGAGAAVTVAVLLVAAWLLAPKVAASAFVRVERVRATQNELAVDVRTTAPRRANIVLPIIDLPNFFGGYIGVFNLARRLAESGVRVRLVTSDPQPRLPPRWREHLGGFEGVARALELVEVEFAGDGRRPIEVSPEDSFAAVSAGTAYVANRASAALGRARFVHVIQDYDPLSFPTGSMAAVARAAYALPHHAVFSTEPLREYFRSNRLGVFAEGDEAGERRSVVFRSAITPVGPVSEKELARRPRRALLFYARPEEHASRNMFELGYVTLNEAIADGAFVRDWRFAGVGSVKPLGPVELPGAKRLELLPRMGQREYAAMLGEFSVGLSLMDSPHPSLVPLEMAAAGMAVVTSTFADKDAGVLRAISPNLIPAAPTPASVTSALREAARRAEDLAGRALGSQLDWPTTWDEALRDDTVRRVAGWLGGP